jgi:hypothetical protein
MAYTNLHETYDMSGGVEDVMDAVYNVDPTETPFMSNVGRGSVHNTLFEIPVDELTAASGTPRAEGFFIGDSTTAVNDVTVVQNYVQINAKDYRVSGTSRAAQWYGRDDTLGYQRAKAIKELKRDMETALLDNNSAAAGASGTARETAGLPAWIKTNVDMSATNGASPVWTTLVNDERSDGVQRAFTETILKSVVKQVWDSGGDPSLLMVGSFNKQAVSAFAGIADQRVSVSLGGQVPIIGAADFYQSDFGVLAVIPNRFQRARDAFVIDPEYAEVQFLRPVEFHELAKVGDGDGEFVLAEFGLAVKNEKAHGIAADLTTS